MKTVITTLLLYLVTGATYSTVAQEQMEEDSDKVSILQYKHKGRPRIPSLIIVECYYSSGHLRFTMPADAEYLYIIIGEEEVPVWTGMVTREYPETDIPVLIGEYEITCRTDGNQIFGGVLNF